MANNTYNTTVGALQDEFKLGAVCDHLGISMFAPVMQDPRTVITLTRDEAISLGLLADLGVAA